MEHKLYYQDPYIQSFLANLTKQAQDENGNWYVVLDQTAFYPTGGGQPFDTGTIQQINVVNVEEIEGEIRHYLESPLPNQNDKIQGTIDWTRRFDHMQQHAGQHILSAAFEELFDFQTVSFHLGSELLTIDLDTEELSEEQASKVEERANQIILENRPIQPTWVSPEEAGQYPLRKQLSVSEDIRLVIIPDFDYNGCGGTHPHSTGQVGSIKIVDWERQRKKIRVQFVCGNRVRTQLAEKHKVLKSLSPLLNAPESEMAAAVKKILDSLKETDKALEEAQEALLKFEAAELLQHKTVIKNKQIIGAVFENRSIQELQKLGRMLVSQSNEIIVILVSQTDQRLQLVCARGENAGGNMKQLIASLLQAINGKGGGNETFAQGGGEAVLSGEQLLNRALEQIVE
ncbi:alanyl-tRNA editing protein [Neobacillus sp. LXY-4]|uniref:alanyl-tRNA editing protein n=1 Tax=Neobacillus sp. LXY-4 TaxID=3379826 RepID=UPI003EE2C36D